MKKMISVIFVMVCLICTSINAAEVISITGSSTIKPVVKAAGKLFKKKTGIKIVVKGGGSSVGVKTTEDGSSDIGAVSRKLKKSEPKDLVATLIGLDGVAVILNIENKVSNLTKEQVFDIYIGKITNWKDAGGKDGKISVVTKAKGRSTKGLFEKYFGLKNKVISSANIIGSNQEDIAFVSGDPSAIGYVSIGSAEDAIKKGIGIKLPALGGVKATIENVANKTFPIRRPLNLVTKGEPAGKAGDFIDFMLSLEGQKIVEKKGFIKVK